jgi:hopanoid biosynthesis associated radical SAM protein HpnH
LSFKVVMSFSFRLTSSLTGYLLKQKITGKKRYPLVLMLEPLFKCNLHCTGCGRIREFADVMDRTLSKEECLAAVDEAGAPVVSITGGEPLLHPQITEIVSGLVNRRKFVNLCTNGLLLKESLDKFQPTPYLSFVVHLDSLAETHDRFANRPGTFDTAIAAIREAKDRGFQVLINTTVYKQSNIEEVKQLWRLLAKIPVDGIMVAPAFSYEAVNSDVFPCRSEAVEIFKPLYEMRREVPFYNTPLYLRFLAGGLDLKCTPWSTPTRNTRGWKSPCYLLTDGHYASYQELMTKTLWEKYGTGNDSRCADCMVHCGYEASALGAMKRPANLWQMLREMRL